MVDFAWIIKNRILMQHNRLYEKPAREKLRTLHGNQFVDIGANIGLYTLLLKNNFHHVHAFEPNPETFKTLQRNTRKLSNVSLYNIALTNHDGMVDFYDNRLKGGVRGRSDAHSGSSLFSEFKFSTTSHKLDAVYRNGTHYIVPGHTYDAHFSSYFVDLVKIDVEGAEFLVLEGMKRSLGKDHVGHMLIELHDADRKTQLEEICSRNGQWLDENHFFC